MSETDKRQLLYILVLAVIVSVFLAGMMADSWQKDSNSSLGAVVVYSLISIIACIAAAAVYLKL